MHKSEKNNQSINHKINQLTWLEFIDETTEQTFDSPKEGQNYNNHTLYPIQLINDFNKFIAYISHHNVQLTKKRGHLPRKSLLEINKLLTVQHKTATIHSAQEAYPYIHFFFHIALKGRLIEINGPAIGTMKLQTTERLSLFQEIPDVEKYLFILETFWIDVDWNDVNHRNYNGITQSVQEVFYYLMLMISKSSIHPTVLNKYNDKISNQIRNWGYFLLYFEWLGFWKCETDEKAISKNRRKNDYFARSITLTQLGSDLIPILLKERNFQFWNIPFRQENGEINPIPGSPLKELIFVLPEEIEMGFSNMIREVQTVSFVEPFKKVFNLESLQCNLTREMKMFIHGQYSFKVFYTRNVWRILVLQGEHTMEQLHELILKAFDFDNEHLYSFFMDGQKWSNKSVVSPLDDSGLMKSNEIRIGDIGLSKGQSFTYLYDYGDEWMFTIVVEQVSKRSTKRINPHIKEQKGKSPIQYIDWDDI